MRRGVDLVLDSLQYALILDLTNGKVATFTGPTKPPLSGDDAPVQFDGAAFVRGSVEEATKGFLVAGEGDYIVLENPATDGTHPPPGTKASAELLPGRKVNIPGPVSFALWPGQAATKWAGHRLRSNQFLMAVVYNDQEASANWGKTVMKPQESQEPKTGEDAEGEGDTEPKTPDVVVSEVKAKVGDLTMGKRLIIKGTEVSFFIPPTGIEVVPDEENNFVRDAVTLETLEYCILVGENGEKRYVRGPDVVFLEPTDDLIRPTADGKKKRKFRAIELNEETGIYVKVIADYEEGAKKYKEGDELFITGAEQRIYFPRPEHAIVKYDGKSKKMYAVTIPEGEARYVLDKRDQKITMIRGSKIFLPDPRHQVIVRRVLSEKEVSLWFPDNAKAVSYNAGLAAMEAEARTPGYVSEYSAMAAREPEQARGVMSAFSGEYEEAGPTHIEDIVRRQTQYTPPRTLVLDSKFDGAVLIDVWTGYAVQVRNKTGDCAVVVGPQPRLLEYDETLDALDLSMGTPKSRKNDTLRTVYLRVTNNRVSDKIKAQTADLVDVSLVVAYRVDFGGEKEKWFDVEDYVQLLTEHTRSMIRNHVKQLGVQAFMANSVALVRNMILGAPDEGGKRAGLKFEENGMEVRDVEVLDVTIGDSSISTLLFETQHEVVRQAVSLASAERSLELSQKRTEIARQIAKDDHETEMARLDLAGVETEKKSALALQRLEDSQKVNEANLEATKAEETITDETAARSAGRTKATQELEVALKRALAAVEIDDVKARTEAFVRQVKAIDPGLIAALQVHGDKLLTAAMIDKLTPIATLTGTSVPDVLKKLTEGMALGGIVDKLAGANGETGVAGRIAAHARSAQE